MILFAIIAQLVRNYKMNQELKKIENHVLMTRYAC